jgi:hypothetical protein
MQYVTWLLESASYSGRLSPNLVGGFLGTFLGVGLPNILRGLTPSSLHPLVNAIAVPSGQLMVQLSQILGASAGSIPVIDF